MTHEFRNAYAFIPREVPASATPFPGAENFGLTPQTAAQGHAVYVPATHSGIIHATITLEQPTVIGNEQVKNSDKPTAVKQYLFAGQPAIPASTLKGLLSFWAEAASGSAYRLVHDVLPLTVRDGRNPRTPLGKLPEFVPQLLRSGSGMSPVNALFGFVQPERAEGDALQALSGKLRFSHGKLVQQDVEVFENSIVLKELSGPMKNYPIKGPAIARSATANFYMEPKSGDKNAYIAKGDFADKPSDFQVRGAKAYLHHPLRNGVQQQPWKTRKPLNGDAKTRQNDRQVRTCLLKRGTQFSFTIRLDNLTDAELELLCFALRPSERFRHKIGMGRPLGLGSARIDVDGLTLVDRKARYSTPDIFAGQSPFADPRSDAPPSDRCSKHKAWLTTHDPDALQAILLIGETHDFDDDAEAQRALGAEIPVLWVPLTAEKYVAIQNEESAAAAEDRSFAWFQQNDKPEHSGQRLASLSKDSKTLPVLASTWQKSLASVAANHSEPVAQARTSYSGIIDPLKREGDQWRFITQDDGTEIGVPVARVREFEDRGGLNPGDSVTFDFEHYGVGKFRVTWIEKI